MRPRGGEHFSGQFDGEPGNPDAGSIILSRGLAEISMASYGSLIAAAGGIRPNRARVLNAEIQGRDPAVAQHPGADCCWSGRLPHPLTARRSKCSESYPPAGPARGGRSWPWQCFRIVWARVT